MKVGFTGTRNGMTEEQLANFQEKIVELMPTEFHHGDCVGADDEADEEVLQRTVALIHIHPPVDESMRAHSIPDVLHSPLTYLARNRQIVKLSDIMIACPPTNHEIKKGGTWYTINHSRKQGVPVWILYPDGRMELQ